MAFKTVEQHLMTASDEGRGGGQAAKAAVNPEVVRVGEEDVKFTDLVDGFKFARANHQRATELKREREALDRERQSLQALREADVRRQEEMIAALGRFAPAPEKPGEARPSITELIAQVDLVTDEEGTQKLSRLLAQREADTEARFAALKAEMDRKLGETRSQMSAEQSAKDARQRAIQEVVAENNRLFEQTMETEYADVVRELGKDKLPEIRTYFDSMVGAPFGHFDDRNLWHWDKRAVDASVRAHDGAHKVLLAREGNRVRSEMIGPRLRGHEATDSLPGRRPAPAGQRESELLSRGDEIRQLYTNRRISRQQAEDMLGTVDEAREILKQLRAETPEGP
jgi:hypothetical protein